MNGAFWSLNNKLSDIRHAVDRSNAAWARMAAYEFAIRLDHAVRECNALLEQAGPEADVTLGHRQMSKQLESIRRANDKVLENLARGDFELVATEVDELTKATRFAEQIWARLAASGGRTSDPS